ncbi:hypothetical protein TRFO_08185 [Tritrichomonas foetus]|uniref:Uncharacterized protein n=1 Tax=Tritrichomonas foetus TaxID=1144522 RepID=A0A1J4JL93_9EUKA|nr:hypothetical protein TRFO_08185 [Tritrichomonas foetus]|eukprot:OHS99880.1 hypothetical protein TRFO_08185 [Tritrichomonas foetus]
MNSKPVVFQIQKIVQISKSLSEALNNAISQLPPDISQTALCWVNYFYNVQLQFTIFLESYSEVLISQHLDYIKEVLNAISDFQSNLNEIDKIRSSFDFSNGLTKLSKKLQNVIQFVSFLRSIPFDFVNSLKNAVNLIEDFLSSCNKKEESKNSKKSKNKSKNKTKSKSKNHSKNKSKHQSKHPSKAHSKSRDDSESDTDSESSDSSSSTSSSSYSDIDNDTIQKLNFTKTELNKITQGKLNISSEYNDVSSIISGSRNQLSDICKKNPNNVLLNAYQYISLSCYHFYQLIKPISSTSRSLFTLAFIVNSLSIHLRSITERLDSSNKSKSIMWSDYFFNQYKNFSQLIIIYNTPQPQERRKADYNCLNDFLTQFNDLYENREELEIGDLSFDLRNCLIDVLEKLQLGNEPKIPTFLTESAKTTRSFYNKTNGLVGNKNLPLYSSNLIKCHSKRNIKRKLTSSQSMENLSLSGNRRSGISSSSYGFRLQKRKPILIDPKSPIRRKPSGRHITFNFDDKTPAHSKSLILPESTQFDPNLLLPYLENPPFIGYLIPYLREKVKVQQPPSINYVSVEEKYISTFGSFHLLSFKEAITKTKEELEMIEAELETTKKRKQRRSSIHFLKKKNSKTTGNNSKSSVKKAPVSVGLDEISTVAMKETNMFLRKCSQQLKDAKAQNDDFMRLKIVIEWYKMVCKCLPDLVNCYKKFPNDEFVVDASREYEHVKLEFDEILADIEFQHGLTLLQTVQQSAKQLSLMIVSLDTYGNNEKVKNNSQLSNSISKIRNYLTESLHCLQIIVDCNESIAPICCSEYIMNLKHSILTFIPVFNDLEMIVHNNILMFTVNSFIETLKPVASILQRIDINDKNTERDIIRQFSYLRNLTEDFLINSGMGYEFITMASNLIKECFSVSSVTNPLFIRDLNEIANVVESSFIQLDDEQKDKDCLNVYLAMRKLQIALMQRIGKSKSDNNNQIKENNEDNNEDTNEDKNDDKYEDKNEELVQLVKKNESDFNELANLIHRNAASINIENINSLSIHWVDSIHHVILAFSDLLTVLPVLNKLPYLYENVTSYFGKIINNFMFFSNPKIVPMKIYPTLNKLLSNLTTTQNFLRLKPFLVSNEKFTKMNWIKYEKFDFDKYKYGFCVNIDHLNTVNDIINKNANNHSINDQQSFDTNQSINKIKILKMINCVSDKLMQSFDPLYAKNYLCQLLIKIISSVAKIGEYFIQNRNASKRIHSINESLREIVFIETGEKLFGTSDQNSLKLLLFTGDFISNFFNLINMFILYEESLKDQEKTDSSDSDEEINDDNSNSEENKNENNDNDDSENNSEENENCSIKDEKRKKKMKKANNDDDDDDDDEYNEKYSDDDDDDDDGKSKSDSEKENRKKKPIEKPSFEEISKSINILISQLTIHNKKSAKKLKKEFSLFVENNSDDLCQLFINSHNFFVVLTAQYKKLFKGYHGMRSSRHKHVNILNSNCEINKNQSLKHQQQIEESENEVSEVSIGNFNDIFDPIYDILKEINSDSESESNSDDSADNSNSNEMNSNKKPNEKKLKEKDSKCESENNITSEQLFKEMCTMKDALDNDSNKAANSLLQLANSIKSYSYKTSKNSYSEKLVHSLAYKYQDFVEQVKQRYILLSKPIINESINSLIESIILISEMLYRRDNVMKIYDPELLLSILSSELAEASLLSPKGDDHSFVLKTITGMAVAIIHADIDEISSVIDSLKTFILSFDYFIEVCRNEINNEVLSNEMLIIIQEFASFPISFAGCFAPKICLQFLLIEAENE